MFVHGAPEGLRGHGGATANSIGRLPTAATGLRRPHQTSPGVPGPSAGLVRPGELFPSAQAGGSCTHS